MNVLLVCIQVFYIYYDIYILHVFTPDIMYIQSENSIYPGILLGVTGIFTPDWKAYDSLRSIDQVRNNPVHVMEKEMI